MLKDAGVLNELNFFNIFFEMNSDGSFTNMEILFVFTFLPHKKIAKEEKKNYKNIV